jgi:very-short-patch-repair endonuclease/alkylated DNA nucleotide flippase Atl1
VNDAERTTLDLARTQHGAISRRQALGKGMSARAIDHRLATGEWVRLFRGAYRLAGSECTFEQQVMAGTLAAGDGAVASHRAAAALFGMPGAPRWVEITVPRTSRVELTGVIAHRTRLLASGDVSTVRRIPVTKAGRTIADLARVYSKARLSPMLDYALAERLVSRADLEARATGRRHDDVLRELLDERPTTARPMGSEFEASLFRALREAGLPLPVPQYRVLMPDGCLVFLDFAYPDVKLAIEADSYIWHASLADWQRDRARNGELVVLGWSILPITWDLAMRNPAEMARRVGGALEARLVTRDRG